MTHPLIKVIKERGLRMATLKRVFGFLLCLMGLHKWVEKGRFIDECDRYPDCVKERVFLYGRDNP